MVAALIVAFAMLPCGSLRAQFVHNKAYESKIIRGQAEIDKLYFVGNNSIPPTELLSMVVSRESDRSLTNSLIEAFRNKLEECPLYTSTIPQIYHDVVNKSLSGLVNEVQFFDRTRALQDTKNILIYYEQFGFHSARCRFEFGADTAEGINILRFVIEEGARSKIRSLVYVGLDSLPAEIEDKIKSIRSIRSGDLYNEYTLYREISTIKNMLADNGYYSAHFSAPVCERYLSEAEDSVYVAFSTGKRQRIGRIEFVDDRKNQSVISDKMKIKQMAIDSGDFYSNSQISRSIENLQSLATFDRVTIDTVNFFNRPNDTIIDLSVRTVYNKQQEYGVAPYGNQTRVDNFINGGIEMFYFHRNIFGAAQTINPYFRFVVQDISRAIYNWKNPEFEFQFGVNFAQPLLWVIDKARVGLSFQALFSQRNLNDYFKVRTFSLPIRFPVNLGRWTYYNNIDFEFTLERQEPLDFDNTLARAKSNAKTSSDSTKIQEVLSVYRNLDKYIRNSSPILTANIMGISIYGDSRDNIFSPTSGHFSSISLEGQNWLLYPFEWLVQSSGDNNKVLGISKFFKFQMSNYWFFPLNSQAVLALKQRIGSIYWFDKSNSYVPFDKQFFAGGANSVRGWASRQLRYTREYAPPNDSNFTSSFAQDFIGSNTLIEGSLEYRYKFVKPLPGGQTSTSLLASFGAVAFLDWGNAFQWLLVDSTGEYTIKNKWYDYLRGLAVAAGVGLRYETPVGPVRLDFAWPIWDPNKEKLITQQMAGLKKFVFHIGIGHSF